MRHVDEIIWHCTATREGQHVTVEQVTKWHKSRKPPFRTIGYHELYYLDGSEHHGRPISETGAHVAGRNKTTIGLCYVGGLDKNGRPKDTRTPAQKAAMLAATKRLLKQYPTIKKISGHRQYANKACPCFDAEAEYAHLLKNKSTQTPEPPSGPTPPENAKRLSGTSSQGVCGFLKGLFQSGKRRST